MPARALAAVLALLAAALTGCGGTAVTTPAWRASHPDPTGITFDETANGLCALQVEYPDQAPAAIDYLGTTYVQHSRGSAGPHPPGTVVAHSAGWTVSTVAAGLALDTGSAVFEYRPAGSC